VHSRLRKQEGKNLNNRELSQESLIAPAKKLAHKKLEGPNLSISHGIPSWQWAEASCPLNEHSFCQTGRINDSERVTETLSELHLQNTHQNRSLAGKKCNNLQSCR
jgi:hypothetical protein